MSNNEWLAQLKTFKNDKELYAAIAVLKTLDEPVVPEDCEIRPYAWKGAEPFPELPDAPNVQFRINNRKGVPNQSDQQVLQGRVGAMQRLNAQWLSIVAQDNKEHPKRYG